MELFDGNDVTPFFKETGFKSVITEFAFALAAHRGEEYLPSGTAVTLCNNLLVTAKHVIEQYQITYDGKIGTKQEKANFSLVAIQGINEGTSVALWNVRKIWKAEITDAAFLLIEPFSEEARQYSWRRTKVDLEPPTIGKKIFAFGYQNPRMSVNKKKEIRWELHPTTSVGEIKEIFFERRERGFLNFPCVQTDVKFEKSMSGGPVFNEQGLLCGLICSGLDDGTDSASSVSYYSLLWPSLATKLDVNRRGYPKETSYLLLDLIKDGIIKAVGSERVTISEEGQAAKISYNYESTSE